MAVTCFHFLLAVLATWRITHLLSKEDGPFDIFFRVKKQLGQGFFGSLLDCFYCLSIWISIPFGVWVGSTVMEKIICCIGISGAASIIQKFIDKQQPPPFFED